MGRLTHGELFAGISGFGLGFARSEAIDTRWAVEIDPSCRRVLAHHHPDAAIHEDVRTVGAHNLERVDIISFGSPCQDLSVAGKRKGFDGERSGLYFEAIRVIAELRPAVAVWENVPGALSSNGGRDFGAALDALAELGALDIAWRVLDAQYFGVAQRRRRVFVVADFRGERAAEILALADGLRGDSPPRRAPREDIAGPLSTGASSGGGFRQDLDGTTYVTHALTGEGHDASEDGTSRGTPIIPVAFNWQTGGDMRLGMSTERGNALGTSQTPAVNTTMAVRRLTPTECCRLQGFDDDWLDLDPPLSDSTKYRMLGNAVAVPVAAWLGERIAGALLAEVTP